MNVDIPSAPASALQFDSISKSFFGVQVLTHVSFAIAPGQTVGLVGENGAGKSTLMNILGGNLLPDNGAMLMNGRNYKPRSPHDARAAGVAFVHQELNLFPNLSIAENLFLTGFPSTYGVLRHKEILSRSRTLLDQVGLDLPASTPLERLSTGERQLVEIAKALGIEPNILILDEPTTSLTSHEADHLFELIGQLRQRNIAMIYISHALNDVMRLCDDIVVLRDGEQVASGPREAFTIDKIITQMVGREICQLFPPRSSFSPNASGFRRAGSVHASETQTKTQTPTTESNPGHLNSPLAEVLLNVRAVSQPGIVENVSFGVRHGEIVGISGLMGSGRTELARIIFGLDPITQGHIELNGHSIETLTPRKRMQLGLAFLTEDRRDEGLCMEASIGDNITLASAPDRTRGPFGWLDHRALGNDIRSIRESVALTKTAETDQPVKTLSGGNQQKVVLAKWLLNRPKLLILDEPTRGIDVGAKHEIYSLINRLADDGTGVLMISSEIEELIGMCDRILVMSRGEIRDEIDCNEFNRERIMKAALHDGHLKPTTQTQP